MVSDVCFMALDFGSIKSYSSSRGFGFVSRTFSSPHKIVFFHIREMKRRYPESAQKLDNGEAVAGFNFWYDTEITEKGEKVSKLWLNADNIPQSYMNELDGLLQKVEDTWRNIESTKPTWLDSVTTDLIGVDRRNKLSAERDSLVNNLRSAEEEQRKKTKALQENDIERIVKEHKLTRIKAVEFHQLLTEMRPLNFRSSKHLSQYIVSNQLGCRYPNISGIVRMEESDTQWDFHGGFPTRIYKMICQELDLANQGTNARAIKFTSFKDAEQNAQELPSTPRHYPPF